MEVLSNSHRQKSIAKPYSTQTLANMKCTEAQKPPLLPVRALQDSCKLGYLVRKSCTLKKLDIQRVAEGMKKIDPKQYFRPCYFLLSSRSLDVYREAFRPHSLPELMPRCV